MKHNNPSLRIWGGASRPASPAGWVTLARVVGTLGVWALAAETEGRSGSGIRGLQGSRGWRHRPGRPGRQRCGSASLLGGSPSLLPPTPQRPGSSVCSDLPGDSPSGSQVRRCGHQLLSRHSLHLCLVPALHVPHRPSRAGKARPPTSPRNPSPMPPCRAARAPGPLLTQPPTRTALSPPLTAAFKCS